LRRILAELGPQGRVVLVAVVLVVVEGATIAAIPMVVATTVDHGILTGSLGWAGLGAAMIALLTAVQLAAIHARIQRMGRVTQDSLRSLRLRMLSHLYELDLAYFGREPAGRVVAKLTSDVDSLQPGLEAGLPMAIRAATLLAFSLAAMLVLSPLMTGVVLLALSPLVAATFWYRPRAFRSQLLVRERNAAVLSHANESLTGVKVVQAHAAESLRYQGFTDANTQMRLAQLRAASIAIPYQAVPDVLGPLGLAVVLGVGAWLVGAGSIEVGAVVAFTLYVNRLLEPIQQAVELANLMQTATASFARIVAFLDTAPRIVDAPHARDFEPGLGRVQIQGVTFTYPGRTTPAIVDLELSVEPGERLAIVGESGAGKSTVAMLLTRTYDPDCGRVLVDRQDLRAVRVDTLSDAVTLVAQDGFLFDATVGENIAMARPRATVDDARAAAAALGILDRLNALPDGLDTQVTNGGRSLSAGQRQLVALTRAMVAQPRVLVLDEATSQLDPATDALVERAMATLFSGRTAIVIAHRLATVRSADRVAVLEGGRLAEVGRPEELLAHDGAFRRWAEGAQRNNRTQATTT
jgi:ATP-binding cassette subfamily B protein